MKTYPDCFPCFLRQTLSAGRMLNRNEAQIEVLMRSVLAEMIHLDPSQSPPVMGRFIHGKISELMGVEDPYREIKHRSNEAALALSGMFERLVISSADPLQTAVRLSIAGNIIDYGAGTAPQPDRLKEAILRSMSSRLHGDIDLLGKTIEDSSRILFLADNAGEIVFDRILIDRVPSEKVTVAVRGGPAINDALYEDAEVAGLTDKVPVIDTGSNVPGVLLGECSEMFQKAFHDADIVIAKGQGNFETLSDTPKPIFFMLCVKCRVVAKHLGVSEGDMILFPLNISN